MNTYLKPFQALIGTTLLGSTLLFGVSGLVTSVQAQQQWTYQKDDVYIEECGACHLAYPPGLLPMQSWQKLMAGLEDHFGEDAELDEETVAHLNAYLETEALRPGQPTIMSELLRNLPKDPPLRISELPAFLDAHEIVGQQLDMTEFPEGFLSPCRDCHRQADDAVFDKQRMHPGYGPSTWGGGKPE